MSKYTTELRFICESVTGNNTSQGYSKTDGIIENAREKIFDFDFPIFDEDYRSVLETKILRHYYFREIGFETVGLWKFHLQNKLNEIMPYYNKLYKSELLEFNPLYEVDLTRTKKNVNDSNRNTKQNDKSDITFNSDVTSDGSKQQVSDGTGKLTKTYDLTNDTTETGSVKDKGSVTDNSTSVETKLFQDTPQNDFGGNLDDKYLSNRTKTTVTGDKSTSTENTNTSNTDTVNTQTGTVVDDNTTKNTVSDTTKQTTKQSNTTGRTDTREIDETAKTTDDYLEQVKGKSSNKSFSSLLKEFRDTFLNIDMMIIEELDELFFQLW